MANDNYIIPSFVSSLLHNSSFSLSLSLRRQEPSEGDVYLPTTTTQSTNLMAMDLYLSSLLFRQNKCQRPSSSSSGPHPHSPSQGLLSYCQPASLLHLQFLLLDTNISLSTERTFRILMLTTTHQADSPDDIPLKKENLSVP